VFFMGGTISGRGVLTEKKLLNENNENLLNYKNDENDEKRILGPLMDFQREFQRGISQRKVMPLI